MAKDLRSRKSGMGGTKPFAKKPEIDPRQEDFIRRAVEQNQGRDKDDLQKELFEPAGLESFMQSVGPMLTPEQRAQMETLVRSLKNS